MFSVIFCSFLGLFQSLPVTSYVKMIDIWMLFTMTIPFLEVVLHTTYEVISRTDFGQERQIRVVRVQPVVKLEDDQEEMPESSSGSGPTIMRLSGRFILPISALIFIIALWVVGLIKSYSSGNTQGPNMFDCIVLDIS